MRQIFLKRRFLNPVSTLTTSYIYAHVEDSKKGEVHNGANMLTIADCHGNVEFEFYLGSKAHRRRSLAKINLLIDVLTQFRNALKKESELIDKF